MASSYKQPSKLNVVSITLVLALAAAGYFAWKWGPPYLQGWKVDSILHEGAASIPTIALQGDNATRTMREADLATKLRGQIQAVGIDDPNLRVTIRESGDSAYLDADWVVTISHPGNLHEPTIEYFHREVVEPLHPGGL